MPEMICITGMHRSGTSLVTSWLESCGLKLYDKVGAHIGNPLGHYEDEQIYKIHMAAMHRIREKSKGWIAGRKSKLLFTKEEQSRLIEIVNQRNRSNTVWGWKDPRASLFLDEWKKIAPEMKAVLLWRDCDLVVDSLIRRSKKASEKPDFQINHNQAVRNWKIYNESIYNYFIKNKENSILVNIDFILKHSIEIIQKVNEKWDIKLEEKSIVNNYQKEMIKLEVNDVPWITRFYKKVYNIKVIENKLTEASFAK